MSNESLKLTIVTALCVAEQTNVLPVFDCATEDELKELIQTIREVFPEFLKRNLIPVIRLIESPESIQLKYFSALSLISMSLLAEQLSTCTGEPESDLLLRVGTMAAEFYDRSSPEELDRFLNTHLSFLRKHAERN